jgi:urea carboxylase
MLEKVLIANRGAIACRVERTLRRLGIASVAVHSEADLDSLHVDGADESVAIGPGPAAQSYLDPAKILEAARRTGAQGVHPGYGFLSENPAFAQACEDAGIAFLGPTPEQMRVFGLKHSAREAAVACGVPLLPGTGLLPDVERALGRAAGIGYPVMLKSTAGGGGIGMRRCPDPASLREAWDSVRALAEANFKDAGLYLEKCVDRARHVEVQVFGDGKGRVVALAERDCSAQRRNQKVLEETPAPGLPESVREGLREAALRLARSVSYRSAGTVEFVVDAGTLEYWFLEVNTRLQVEHGVSEEVHGVDLVEWMVRLGGGDSSFLDDFRPVATGHSIQARVYAEDPARNFVPCSGRLTEVSFPETARIETWVSTGCEVPPWYDPMLAKIVVHGKDRAEALAKLDGALAATRLAGIGNNLEFLRAVVRDPVFSSGETTTSTLGALRWEPTGIEALEPGAQTTVQDWPGRQGLWNVGIPPSGPMDSLSFRLGNLALGNPEGAAGLEFVFKGPSLRGHEDRWAVLTGADFGATLDGTALPPWKPFLWKAGSVLRLPRAREGARGYLLVSGGIDVPEHLGSRSTFALGGFGGHGGRALRTGDRLLLLPASTVPVEEVPRALRPGFDSEWRIGVLLGPHAAPDYFLPEDLDDLFGTPYEVHYNSDRTGVRLVGPRPRWARADGGEAGLHPSNLHDNAYVVGTLDFTGDTPVILGPDGPSLGGFACPVTIALAELWKTGQLAAGHKVRFEPVSHDAAREAQRSLEASLSAFGARATIPSPAAAERSPAWSGLLTEIVLHERGGSGSRPSLRVRQDGDDAFLVEFGPMVLDLELRLRVHVLYSRLDEAALPGVLDLTPGIRSLQVRFDPSRIERNRLLDRVLAEESAIGDLDDIEIPNRIVHLPLSWDDPQTRLAIEKYTATVNPNAPWCPSNLEFIRRVNGLDSIEDVQRIVFDAEYLVMGLGDVYLGAPVATPLDPRHRLVTTKYNPARTWTPENAVGIGGAYLCVYGMEGPGGYQFVGRTVQMWNRWRSTGPFDKPWLLRFFDVLRFEPVGVDELLRLREDFPRGRWAPRIEPSTFKLGDYRRFLSRHDGEIEEFRSRQRAAFAAERERWEKLGVQVVGAAEPGAPAAEEVPAGCEAVRAEIPGSLWKYAVAAGDRVSAGDVVAVLESMKMESPVHSPCDGTVESLVLPPGQAVSAGSLLAVVRP